MSSGARLWFCECPGPTACGPAGPFFVSLLLVGQVGLAGSRPCQRPEEAQVFTACVRVPQQFSNTASSGL